MAIGAEVIEDSVDALLDGVEEVDAQGVPGPLCVYGPGVFPVVVGAFSDVHAPVMAAGYWQQGRVVTLSHGGYFTRATLETADTGRLITNALRWAAREVLPRPRIGVVSSTELLDWLAEAGHDVAKVALTPNSLEAVDVVALDIWNQ